MVNQEIGPNGWGDRGSTRTEIRPPNRVVILVCAGLAFAAGLIVQHRFSMSPDAQRVLPGEFERQEALLVGWDTRMTDLQLDALASIVAACHRNINVLLVAHQSNLPQGKKRLTTHERLSMAGVPEGSVSILDSNIAVPWVRDFGPFVLKSFDGQAQVVDTTYGEAPGCEHFPKQFARQYQMPFDEVEMVVPGGNLLSNGAGLYLATTRLLEVNAKHYGYSPSDVSARLRDQFGATQTVFLTPMKGEPTGHLDMFATFIAADTVVVGEYDATYDPVNAKILDSNAELLQGIRTPCGPMKVVRVPMPRRIDAKRWLTYTNVVFANGVLIVPSYPSADQRLEYEVLDRYRNLLRGWSVVPVDSEALMLEEGGPHCITMNVYQLEPIIVAPPSP